MSRTPTSVARAAMSWLDATDPGAVRRQHAERAAFASVCAWLTMRLITELILHHPQPPTTLFAVVASFVAVIVVSDPRRRDRMVSMAAVTVGGSAALVVSSLLSDRPNVRHAVLLSLMFMSFAVRRFGQRPGEVALAATLMTYFGNTSDVSNDSLWWYLGAAAVGFAWVALWQFVLLQYDPGRSLLSAARSFYRRAGELIDAIATSLPSSRESRAEAMSSADLLRGLSRVKLSRRVIENQTSGAIALGGWGQDALGQFQLALFTTEQGLSQMVDSAMSGPWLESIKPATVQSLSKTLDSLATALTEAASPQAMSALAEDADHLRGLVTQAVSSAESAASHESPPLWMVPALDMVRGAQRVARSVAQAREIALSSQAGARPDPAVPKQAPSAPRRPIAASGVHGVQGWHPTTVLGLQAVIAALLGMIVGSVAGLDQVSLLYWTAFLVVAGSAGETVRKVIHRVIGTVAGAAVGVGLAVTLPDSYVLLPLLGTIGIFLAIYAAPVSYARMVFWLNVSIVAASTKLEGGGIGLFRDRTVAVAIGGVVAGVVAVTLCPVRVGSRFRMALGGYFAAIDAVITAWSTSIRPAPDHPVVGTVDEAGARVDAAYPAVQQTLAAAAFETNPFPRTGSPLGDQALRVAAVDDAIHHVLNTTPTTDDELLEPAMVTLLDSVVEHVHADLSVLASLAGGTEARLGPAFVDFAGVDLGAGRVDEIISADGLQGQRDALDRIIPRTAREGPVWSLITLHAALQQLALSIGAQPATSDEELRKAPR